MISEYFSNFIISTNYSKIPEDVIEKAKTCFIDFLGISLRGSQRKSGSIIKEIINDGEDSTVIGYKKAHSLDSALANGTFAHSIDLDDGHRFAQLHPGSCVIPAALAVCEANKRNGKDFLTSMIVGYEVAISLGMLANPIHRNKGFHSTGTFGTFGAAGAASKSLNLRENEIINALGLAGTQSCGLLESDHSGSMAKHLHAGKAAQAGLLSALLAEKGFTGAKSIIDGKEGFLNVMVEYGGFDSKQLELQLDLGDFHIKNVYIKKYPVCRHLHSSLDALVDIINQNNISSEDITNIVIKTYKIASQHDNYQPNSIEAVRQSLPVVMALVALGSDLNHPNMDYDEKNSEIKEMAEKIVIKEEGELEKYFPEKRPSEVILKTKDQTYKKTCFLPQGEPENPLKRSDILDKFIKLNPKVDMDVIRMVEDIENYKMQDIMEILNEEFIITI
mgnify:CR=1 FL=1